MTRKCYAVCVCVTANVNLYLAQSKGGHYVLVPEWNVSEFDYVHFKTAAEAEAALPGLANKFYPVDMLEHMYVLERALR